MTCKLCEAQIIFSKGIIQMKKFTSIVLALIIALSVATVAFAATPVFTCTECGKIVEGEKAYNDHLELTCPVVGKEGKVKVCPNDGCNAAFYSQTEYDRHVGLCPKTPEPTIADKVSDFIAGIDFEEVFGKVVDFLGGLDIAGLVEKVVGFISDAVSNL